MKSYKGLSGDDLDELAVQRLIFDTQELSSVLKGHLFIERLLDTLLQNNLKKPDVLLKNDISFSLKATLVYSLGLIPERYFTAIKELNRIRNKYAHEDSYLVKIKELNSLKVDWEEVQEKAFEAACQKGIEDAVMLSVLFLCWSFMRLAVN